MNGTIVKSLKITKQIISIILPFIITRERVRGILNEEMGSYLDRGHVHVHKHTPERICH